jgi:hypothetical protein
LFLAICYREEPTPEKFPATLAGGYSSKPQLDIFCSAGISALGITDGSG